MGKRSRVFIMSINTNLCGRTAITTKLCSKYKKLYVRHFSIAKHERAYIIQTMKVVIWNNFSST